MVVAAALVATMVSWVAMHEPGAALGSTRGPWAGGMSLDDVSGLAGPEPGSYAWPVSGPVIRGFLAPQDPYGPGHRGIDIATRFGTPVRAANDGIVAFAGWVGGALYVSVDHPDGVRTTYSWLSSVGVRKGAAVRKGDIIAASGHGHPEIPEPHLHFGARIGQTYLDPMLLLEAEDVASLIRLAPLGQSRQ
jgi:murein DD-endopeptidase MepM/ murein hydrolase activator NlpD